MALTLYNTLTRRKEPFVPLQAGRVGFYVCGLTVYDFAHIGHARTYVAFEIIRRWLLHQGFRVKHVRNVTDVDDKIIQRAKELGVEAQAHADKWNDVCNADLDRLGIPPPDVMPKVSTHMPEIIALIGRLIQNRRAYATSAGNVYFDVSQKPDYGKLSNRTPEELMAGARVEPMEDKKDPKDFALWKAQKPGEPSWDSPWGQGRPGWHIECSAMSSRHLGDQIDIHGGGLDLVFPHHENEVAQSEGASGKVPFVRYWLHSGFLTVNGEKMSKSLKNFVTIQDILRVQEPEVVRFFYAYTHYRSGIDYSPNAMEDAKRGLERLRRLREQLQGAARSPTSGPAGDGLLEGALGDLERAFTQGMNDDFNTRIAIAALFDFVNAANKAVAAGVSPSLARECLARYENFARVLTLFPDDAAAGPDLLAPWVQARLSERDEARSRRDFERSDAIRAELLAKGFEIEDTKAGTTWRRAGRGSP